MLLTWQHPLAQKRHHRAGLWVVAVISVRHENDVHVTAAVVENIQDAAAAAATTAALANNEWIYLYRIKFSRYYKYTVLYQTRDVQNQRFRVYYYYFYYRGLP